MKRRFAVILVFLIQCVGLHAQQHLNPSVATWEAKFEYDNELFPSLVLAMTGALKEAKLPADYFGDINGQAEVWIIPAVPDARVHVEVQIDGWTAVSELDATLKEAGHRYRLAPILRYDYSRLAEVDQSIPANMTYSVRVNDVDLGRDMLPIRVRSVNDVPFYAKKTLSGPPADFSFLFAGFVNESHPTVQEILKEALHWKAVKSFTGYQINADEVRRQAFAIWNVLQRRHIHYSSATTPSAESQSGAVATQAVRFLDQSIDLQQANCVDGSVLFASVLYKIGIHPVLIRIPGHMFIGYYLDANDKRADFLETTMIGLGHQPSSSNLPFGSLHPATSSESWQQFIKAIQEGGRRFDMEVRPELIRKNPLYRVIDIAAARKIGINAIPRANR